MAGKFYVLADTYDPNTAKNNHIMSYVRGFEELGIDAELVFLLPNSKAEKIRENRCINVSYLWSEKFAHSKLFKHIYKQFRYAKFFFSLKKGDVVVLLGLSAYVYRLAKKKGIRVYHERTEHPDAVQNSRFKFSMRNYIEGCCLCDGIFVISHALKEFYESKGVDPLKIEVINMTVDSTRFNGVEREKSVDPYIAYCGNASNSKDGVDDLIKSFAIVSKLFPQLLLYIIGNPPNNQSDNKLLAEQLGVVDKIKFTGLVPAEKMPQLLKNATMLALARPNSLQNKYGFPTKLGEYLLTGNPVIVTRVGDIPHFLEDGVSALMSNCRDTEDFANKMIWVMNNYDEALEIGRCGKKVAEFHFNYLTETKKMCNFIFKK